MKRFKAPILVLAIVSLIALGGCTISPLVGAIWTDVSYGNMATESSGSAKMGVACATQWIWIVATGDASVHAAKANGGINTVTSVDHSARNVLGGIWGEWCTIVRGTS